ncbi:MAG: alpha/beta fold hydrolase [Fimbriimonadaceae bacterium]
MLAALVVLALAPSRAAPSFAVKVSGHGPPVILIPGLMCGGDVWDATVAHLKDGYTCYTLTLPGFAGQPPIKAPILTRVRDEIENYVVSQKLDRPILIGHSLGGTLSLWLAADKPELFGPVVSVDGVPALGELFNPSDSPRSEAAAAEALRSYYGALDSAHFAAANAAALGGMITAPSNVARVAEEANRSDPHSVGEAIAEMLENDLRPEMANIKQPVLVLVPAGSATSEAARNALRARYEAQFHDVAEHAIVLVPKSRHFVMLDAPEFFWRQVDEFLLRVANRR